MSEPPPAWSETRRALADPRVLALLLVSQAALLVGVALRIALHLPLDFDERTFLDVGRHILTTGVPYDTVLYDAASTPHMFFDHTPLYVYFVALVATIGWHTAALLRAASLAFALLTVALVFVCALRLRGPVSAFVGATLVATNPFFAIYSWFVRMEVPLAFFLVLAVVLLVEERFLLAGLAIAVAVMLKEIALAFWLVAAVYSWARHGRRIAAVVAFATPVALALWLAYAALLDPGQLASTLDRWLRSGVGDEPTNRRFRITPPEWARVVALDVLGPPLVGASVVAGAIAARGADRVPPIAAVTVGYSVLAVAASFVMSLKEPRFLIAVVPMLALSVALVVGWDEVAARAWQRLRRGRPGARAV